MEETKKVAKPRAPKKAKAAKADVAVETPTTEAVEEQIVQSVAPKKAAKKPAKKKAKAASVAVETAQEAPATETPAETMEQAPTAAEIPVIAEEKPVKKGKKKVAKKQEQPVQETTETPVAEAVKTAEETQAKSPKKTAKKGGRDAMKGKKQEEMPAENAPVENAPVETVQVETETVQPPVQEGAKKPAKKAKKAPKKETVKEEAEPIVTLTKAEKKDAIMALVREQLATPCKWAELLESVAKEYKEKYPSKENEKDSDVKGRIGSVIDLMKKEGEVAVESGVARLVVQTAEQTQETVEIPQNQATMAETNVEEPPAKTVEETPVAEAQTQETTAIAVVEAPAPAPVYDMSSLFDRKKTAKKETKKGVKADVETIAVQREEEVAQTVTVDVQEQAPAAPVQEVAEEKTERKAEKSVRTARRTDVPKRVVHGGGLSGEKRNPLKENFLRRLRSLGGDYFEYYSVYLLERYSRRNGRRLEGMRISGGEHDGGIDGEIEVTDRLGFRETIYIQAKNWAPTDEKWMVGETLLQQFIGAVTYRKAVEGKQHCRGIYITTSCFTTGAKAMLEKMSDQFVGYDGNDLFETAKECEFGLIKGTNGEWKIDEELLSGERALFYML